MIYWNMLHSSQPITLDMMPDLLIRLGPPWGPSVELTVLPRDDGARGRDRPEHRVRICWANESYEFVVEYRARSTPKAIDDGPFDERNIVADGQGACFLQVGMEAGVALLK